MSDHKPVTAEELASVAKLDRLATSGPFRVNRYDCDGGAINWQVQQDDNASGDEVIANITDDEPKRAKHDAAFFALARTLMPRLARDLADARHDLDTERKASAMLADRCLDLGRELEALRAAVRAHEERRRAGWPTPNPWNQADLDLWAAAKAAP